MVFLIILRSTIISVYVARPIHLPLLGLVRLRKYSLFYFCGVAIQELVVDAAQKLVELCLQLDNIWLLLILELIVLQVNGPFLDLLLFFLSVVLIVKLNNFPKKIYDPFLVYFVVFFCIHGLLCHKIVFIVQSEVHLPHQKVR